MSPAIKAAIGMLLTGLVVLILPGREVLGPGLEFIGEAIAEDFSLPLGLMAALLVLKLLATSFTLGAGNSGGVFAPGLFMGAILGGMVGSVAHSLWPNVALNPGAYAIVGMAAVFAGAARAPITAVLIVFEMSNDYKLILPLMFATVLSTFLAEFLFTESIYTLKLNLKGIKLQRGRDLDLLQSMLVREAMTKDPMIVHADMPLSQLGNHFQQTHAHSFPVVDNAFKLVGMVSLRDYDRVENHEVNDEQLKVKDIATMDTLLTAYEDEPLAEAIQRIGVRGVNKMPVVTRNNPQRITGVIRRRDIIRAYNVALARRAKGQFDEDSVRLRRVDGTEFIELIIKPESRAVNQNITTLAAELPYDCVLVSIRRHGNVFIPHGDTVIRSEDAITIFVRRDEEDHLRECLLG
jgi:CIC family chloride channel protein